MATERTLSIIKPDGLEKGIIGKIVARFEEKGLKPIAMRMQHLSQRDAEGFYAVHKARPFFKDLVSFMTSGPVVLMVLEGENAIAKNREVMGATNPANAARGRSGRTSRPTWRRTPSTAPTARRTRRSRSPTSSARRKSPRTRRSGRRSAATTGIGSPVVLQAFRRVRGRAGAGADGAPGRGVRVDQRVQGARLFRLEHAHVRDPAQTVGRRASRQGVDERSLHGAPRDRSGRARGRRAKGGGVDRCELTAVRRGGPGGGRRGALGEIRPGGGSFRVSSDRTRQ